MHESRPSAADGGAAPATGARRARLAFGANDLLVLIGLAAMCWGAELAHRGGGLLVAGAASILIGARAEL